MSDTDTAAENAPAAAPDTDATAAGADYRVLARKYRPATFSGLIGQDVLVRTLTNAIKTGRLAHAFMLTGVRGVGKTTTARIIARALNCFGPDGQGGPTTEPCGRCANCIAISEDRHVDVLEMDAASRTGVDDIRELIDGVRYRPTSARYKVYIIDEVHMLTKNAFNALLKTLEEPPEHVKFVFATTEIRKVPVTVLSRCQRFDLRRVDVGLLENHFGAIAEKEGASLSATALYLIARAADGSVRDGLSLLDQAISRADGEITDTQVRDMLGLADRSQSFELLEAAMAGDAAGALAMFEKMFNVGADPSAVIEDLLEVVHLLTRVKVVPAVLEDPALPEIERRRGRELTERLSMPALSRAWQMLLKAMGEVRTAPSARQAADMALVRLAYTATLPTPEEAMRALEGRGTATATTAAAPAPTSPPAKPAATRPTSSSPPSLGSSSPAPAMARTGTDDTPAAEPNGDPRPEPPPVDDGPRAEAAPQADPGPDAITMPASFADVRVMLDAANEIRLLADVIHNVHLVHFEAGRIEIRPGEHAQSNFASELARFLSERSGTCWMVSISRDAGEPTFAEQDAIRLKDLEAEAARHPMVREVLDAFPGAEIKKVEPRDPD
jgi:DNA polymerase-3 subunit gamma/tau